MKLTMTPLKKRISAELMLRGVILFCGFLLLFAFLDWKPAQHDEGVNGWFIEEILIKGFYEYDPANYHGPLQHYLHFIAKFLFGSNLWALRLPAVCFSFASLWVMMSFRRYLGNFTTYAAVLLTALSPGMIFYSRYAIHEAALYFFTVLTLLGFFRFMEIKDKKSLWTIFLGVTGMLVTKETLVLSVGCFAASYFALLIYERVSPSENLTPYVAPRFSGRDLMQVFGVCLFIFVMLYTGFFLNPKGVTGVLGCFAEWFKTGVSTYSEQKGHWKPFYYWIQLFMRYEWPAFCGLLFCFPLLAPAPRWHRLLMLYAFSLFLAYSLISYKTPWCVIQIIWPLHFVLAAGLLQMTKTSHLKKIVCVVFILALACVSTWKAVSLNFIHYADDKEPYAHVQTYKSLMNIDKKIKTVALEDFRNKHMPIYVLMEAYWPISWLLVDFTGDTYYMENYPLTIENAAVIFCDIERQKRLEMRLDKPYYVERFRLNPSRPETLVYYDTAIFSEFFDEESEKFEPAARVPSEAGEGLAARYYANGDWTGDPVKELMVDTVNFAWEGKERPMPAPFGIVFEGFIFIPVTGDIEFFLASDDGGDLTINEKLVVDNMGKHPEKIVSAKVRFNSGWYPIRVRHNDFGGGASIRLWWKLPGGEEEKITPRFFRLERPEAEQ